MKSSPRYVVPHRRRREGKTDYKGRLRLLKSGKDRFVVRRSLNGVTCQIVRYGPEGDTTLASANSLELKKYGYKAHTGNIPAAYLTGYLCGIRAKKAKVEQAVADMGLHTSVKGSRLYAALKGAVEAGLSVPHSDDILPPKDRAEGKHIADYAAALKKNNPDAYKRQFAGYEKGNFNPETLPKHVSEVKAKLK